MKDSNIAVIAWIVMLGLAFSYNPAGTFVAVFFWFILPWIAFSLLAGASSFNSKN